MKPVAALLAALMLVGLTQTHSWASDTPEGKTLKRSERPVVIAEGGKALVDIVISPDASEPIQATAAVLAEHLAKITGGEFKVVTNNSPSGITLGTLGQFSDARLKTPLAIRNHYDGVEAFVIRTDKGGIRLIANTELGVSHAAYRFLELLGCRWFFMTDTWQIIPSSPALAFDLNEDSRPDIWSRNIWFDRLSQAGEPGDPDAKELYERWKRRNRMAQSLKVRTLHRWHAIPGEVPERFEGHPEFFALVDGTRRGPQFCVSNPGLQEAVIAFARQSLDAYPERDMVSLDPADMLDHCECDRCLKLGPPSCQPFYLANVVARALQDSHPGKYVGLLAYSWHSLPPPFPLEPNVYVQLTRGMNMGQYHPDELYRMWVELGHDTGLGIYEYYCYGMNAHQLPGTKVTALKSNAARIRGNVTDGVTSISAQATDNWGVHGLAYYVANRVMWDAETDVEALRRDFLEKGFGPAAEPMDRFYRRFDADALALPGMALIRGCADDLHEASQRAAGRPDVLARIDDLKKLIVYSFISEQRQATDDKANEKALALKQITWAYRIRNSHMVGWTTLRSVLGHPWSETFHEPDWFWRNTIRDPSRNPWRIDTPVDAGELNDWMQAIQKEIEVPLTPFDEFKPEEYVLVDTGIGPAERKRPYGRIFSTGMTFLLASLSGEPLQVSIQQRPSDPDRPDADWTFHTQDGTLLDEGRAPEGTTDLSLEVPGPGVYRFWCYSRGTGYHIQVPAVTPVAVELDRDERYRPSGGADIRYFYVPRGLRALRFYAYFAGTVRISDSTGKVVHEAPTDGRIVRIPVPPGQDGTVWSIGGVSNMRLRRFAFLDLPTVLSLQPRYLFVPRKTAERDGLNVILRCIPSS